MNSIEIFTSIQIQDKDFVYVNFFHCIYMLCILEKYLDVIFFAMHEKFVLIIIFVTFLSDETK